MEEIQAKIAYVTEQINVRSNQRDNETTSEQMQIVLTNEIAAMINERAALINLQLQGKFPPRVSVVFS